MRIARLAIERPLYTWLVMLFALLGGIAGYLGVGKLEDPLFTIKEALVITPYPGASATEVAIEVSEPLEAEIQQMDEVKTITSRNSPGLSIIEVEVQDTYDSAELPQVWDDLRDRVADAGGSLPSGVRSSQVNDSFGDVYGLYYAVTAPGYSDADLWEIATFLRREVLAVDGVANAEVLGLPQEAIFVEPDTQTMTNLGVPPTALLNAVSTATDIVPTGTATNASRELAIDAPLADDSVSEIGSLTFGAGGQTINLADIAEVSRARVDEPSQIIRFDGTEAFTLGIAGLTSRNIVAVGDAVEARLMEVADRLPLGVELSPIYEQHRVVDTANDDFIQSLMLSVGVVIGVLALFMGWRAAVVVGVTLLLTVTATFFAMFVFDIKVERISLGALIIAMGMLVDNALVVAEGMQQRMRQGVAAPRAAEETAGATGIPLLGATVIGIMAFAGIGLSPDASGEFLFSLFAVIGLSLMLSWFFAVTVTPLLGHYMFRVGGLKEGEDPYGGPVFRGYAGLVRQVLRARWLVIAALIGGTVACVMLFGQVRQQFFPPASTPILYLDYKAAQGTAITKTAADLAIVEKWLRDRDDVVSVTTSAGQGFTRFLLTYAPEDPDPSFGQLLIRTPTPEAIPALRADLDLFVAEALPWAQISTKRMIYGPPVPADIEARFSGADPDILRALANEAKSRLERASPDLHTEAIDWREREPVVRPIFAAERAQALGIERGDVATTIALATDGIRAGVYRERDRIIPIVIRVPRDEMAGAGALLDQQVYAPNIDGYVAMAQVIDGFDVITRDTLIRRRDREPTITVLANVVEGLTPPTVFTQIRGEIEAIPLPEGYSLEWGGEFESAGEAQASLGRQMPLSFGTMLLITILLFGKLRQTAVIWTIVPMAINGVALGLLWTGLPFSFTALLGLLSLSGMLIKNAIVLVEEIDARKAGGLFQSDAIIAASVSRLRPVVLAAATTILGMTPLLGDAFFASMAVTIMAGLGFASILTLIGVPALYHTYLGAERRAEKRARADGKTRPEPAPLQLGGDRRVGGDRAIAAE